MCALVTGVQTCALPISVAGRRRQAQGGAGESRGAAVQAVPRGRRPLPLQAGRCRWRAAAAGRGPRIRARHRATGRAAQAGGRSEEHTSELQSLMRISYAVFCLKKKKRDKDKHTTSKK